MFWSKTSPLYEMAPDCFSSTPPTIKAKQEIEMLGEKLNVVMHNTKTTLPFSLEGDIGMIMEGGNSTLLHVYKNTILTTRGF